MKKNKEKSGKQLEVNHSHKKRTLSVSYTMGKFNVFVTTLPLQSLKYFSAHGKFYKRVN